MPRPVTAVLVGAGQRGHHVYGRWAVRNPQRLRFVAVCDPDPFRRRRFADAHATPAAHLYADPVELWENGRLADACIIASPDRHHHAAAMRAIELGYHVLVEKPVAASLEDTVDLVRRADSASGTVHVAHVLRYTPFFRALHQVIRSGRLGDIVAVEHRENLAAWHMAHSYVRGNWARAADSTPMIVAKCCHDFDILTWNLGSPVRRLASAGSLVHFRPEHRPGGAPDRCVDDCPVMRCPFDARRVYLDERSTDWPVHVITDDLSSEGRLRALRTGPYGRCVYSAGSDVVDHQVVLMELATGATVALGVNGHSAVEQRTMRYDGTRATLRGLFGRSQELTVIDHFDASEERIPIAAAVGGHGGGDEGIMLSLLESVATGRPGPTDARTALESHLLAFAAESARIEGGWLDIEALRGTST